MAIQLSDHFSYRRLLRFCISPVIMMVFTSIYGVVDGLFVSNVVGKVPFAAINLVMPFIMILGAIGFMVGTGGSALVAKTLGEGDRERANRYFTMMVTLTVILGVCVSVIGIILMPTIARLLKATPAMMGDCVLYGRVALAFNTAFMLQNVFQTFLVTAEKPKLGLATTVGAGVTNMVLDALFIAGFRWGVAGAALATGLSYCVGGVLPLIYFLRPNKSLLRLVRTGLEGRALLKACTNGSSELLNNISGSLVSMLYNFQLLRLAGENGVAAYGVLMYINFIFIAVFIGYSIGAAPVVGYNFGAQNHGEMRNVLRKSMVIMAVAGVVMMAAAQLLSGVLAGLFVGYDRELFEMTRWALRVCALCFILAGMNIFTSSFFTALNNGAISALVSFLRTLVFQTSCVIILPIFLGVNGIWWAVTVAEVCAFAVAMAFLAAKRKKYGY